MNCRKKFPGVWGEELSDLLNIFTQCNMVISEKDRKILWSKSGNQCSYNYNGKLCNQKLVESDNEVDGDTVVGEEAHIVGQNAGSARYLEKYLDRDNYNNIILLCGTHHKLVDDNEKIYTVDVLKKMKILHEKEVEKNKNRVLIKDSEFKTEVKNAKKAIGIDISGESELQNVKAELKAENVDEAIGFRSNSTLFSGVIGCDKCGHNFPKVFTGRLPNSVECPNCGNVIPLNIN
ncbi:MAG: hypothetical protein ABIH38_04215 [Patescibacteria group bacterium]